MLTPWKESYDQPRQHIKKQRHYFVNKVHLVKAMVFPIVMYGCESWTIKKAECQRIHAFELWCWRRLLRVPWTARRPNQSILKEISPGCSLERLMLKLKLQFFGHLMHRADSFEKTLMQERSRAGGEWDGRGWDGWMASPTQWTWVLVGSRRWCWTGSPSVLKLMGSQRVTHNWATELNWIDRHTKTVNHSWKHSSSLLKLLGSRDHVSGVYGWTNEYFMIYFFLFLIRRSH